MDCRVVIPRSRSNLSGQPLPNQEPATFNQFLGIHRRVSAIVIDEDRFEIRRDSDGLSTAILRAKSRLTAEATSLVPTLGELAVNRKFDNVELVPWPRTFVQEEVTVRKPFHQNRVETTIIRQDQQRFTYSKLKSLPGGTPPSYDMTSSTELSGSTHNNWNGLFASLRTTRLTGDVWASLGMLISPKHRRHMKRGADSSAAVAMVTVG